MLRTPVPSSSQKLAYLSKNCVSFLAVRLIVSVKPQFVVVAACCSVVGGCLLADDIIFLGQLASKCVVELAGEVYVTAPLELDGLGERELEHDVIMLHKGVVPFAASSYVAQSEQRRALWRIDGYHVGYCAPSHNVYTANIVKYICSTK